MSIARTKVAVVWVGARSCDANVSVLLYAQGGSRDLTRRRAALPEVPLAIGHARGSAWQYVRKVAFEPKRLQGCWWQMQSARWSNHFDRHTSHAPIASCKTPELPQWGMTEIECRICPQRCPHNSGWPLNKLPDVSLPEIVQT